MKIAYLFTTFPVLSETFLQREITALSKTDIDFSIYSIWLGQDNFQGKPVQLFSFGKLIQVLWMLPYWTIRRPRAIAEVFSALWMRRMPSFTNLGEVLLGIGFALVYANHFKREKPQMFHAVWATMPATAAYVLEKLIDIPFSMGAHAYDIYRHRGDWLLEAKIRRAKFIHTTTEAARKELVRRGGSYERIALVRRGLAEIPPFQEAHAWQTPIQIISVGRLIEKKGYFDQLGLYKFFQQSGLSFHAKIVGGGSLYNDLEMRIRELGLGKHVELTGKCSQEAVQEMYETADLFFFTGKVSDSGDRDGLPNVIPEAMAKGLVVFTTDVSGTTEAIAHRETGFCFDRHRPQDWLSTIHEIYQDPSVLTTVRQNARQWVEQNFDAYRNAQVLSEHMKKTLNDSVELNSSLFKN